MAVAFGLISNRAGFYNRLPRLLLPLFLVFGVAFASKLADAQTVPGIPGSQKEAASPPDLSEADLDQFIRDLEDPVLRDRLLSQLRALKALRTGQQPKPNGPALAIPKGIGSEILAALSEQIDKLNNGINVISKYLLKLPEITKDVIEGFSDPVRRANWLDAFFRFLGLFVAAGLAQWLASRLTQPLRLAIVHNGGLKNSPFYIKGFNVALLALLDLLPLVIFAALAYGLLPFLLESRGAHLAALSLIAAHLIVCAILILADAVLQPAHPSLRLMPIPDEGANYARIWLWRFLMFGVYGYCLLQALLLLGITSAVHATLLRFLGLVLLAFFIIMILQLRREMASRIRGRPSDAEAESTLPIPPPVEPGLRDIALEAAPQAEASEPRRIWPLMGYGLRNRLAASWHMFAILYAIAVYLFWLLGVAEGFQYLLESTALTLLLVTATVFSVRILQKIVGRIFTLRGEVKAQFPGLEARANRYLILLVAGIEFIIYGLAILLMLEVWGIPGFTWLSTGTGRRVLGSAISVAVIVGVTFAVVEVAEFLIQRYLNGQDGYGRPAARSARMRTLLPLLRTVIRVAAFTLLLLMVLAEIGLDITPLLAGAGVLGLAIGFGAQSLVKDLINGVFILAEESISIGDVVDLGGNAGVVEAMNIRAIRLRGVDGAVYTVPFSAVTTIKNMTKDYSFALIDARVAYREDIDRVITAMREIGEDLRADPKFRAVILEPMEMLGVDRFEDAVVVLRARIKTIPTKQWDVMREYNRRMKNLFDARGIEISLAPRPIYFGPKEEDKDQKRGTGTEEGISKPESDGNR